MGGTFYNDWMSVLMPDLLDSGKTEDEVYEDAWKVLCHVGHAGEMFTSAAPYDPTFWPLHGLADRFLQYKRLEAAEGNTILDETWGYYHEGTSPSDTHHVCDWEGVEGMQMPTCKPGVCSGHGEFDLLPWSGFISDDTYTNRDFYNFMSPFNDDLPYAYDTFTKWPA